VAIPISTNPRRVGMAPNARYSKLYLISDAGTTVSPVDGRRKEESYPLWQGGSSHLAEGYSLGCDGALRDALVLRE
jgi:hypothetical protein